MAFSLFKKKKKKKKGPISERKTTPSGKETFRAGLERKRAEQREARPKIADIPGARREETPTTSEILKHAGYEEPTVTEPEAKRGMTPEEQKALVEIKVDVGKDGSQTFTFQGERITLSPDQLAQLAGRKAFDPETGRDPNVERVRDMFRKRRIIAPYLERQKDLEIKADFIAKQRGITHEAALDLLMQEQPELEAERRGATGIIAAGKVVGSLAALAASFLIPGAGGTGGGISGGQLVSGGLAYSALTTFGSAGQRRVSGAMSIAEKALSGMDTMAENVRMGATTPEAAAMDTYLRLFRLRQAESALKAESLTLTGRELTTALEDLTKLREMIRQMDRYRERIQLAILAPEETAGVRSGVVGEYGG